MTPRFTLFPPWTVRISLVVALITLPFLFCVIWSWGEQGRLQKTHDQVQQQLATYQKAARAIEQQQRQRQKKQTGAPEVLKLLKPIGLALTPEVALISMDTMLSQRQVQLEVAGKSLPALLDFSARLQGIPARVELQNHRPSQEKDSQWPVSATMSVSFDGEETS